jgi:type IV pilus assembly protein PilV
MHQQYKPYNSGFSMIELAVATAVFSIGLSSLSMMMLAAIGGTSDAQNRTIATAQASSLAEMIAMNSDAVGHYVNPIPARADACTETRCNFDEIAAENMNFWRAELENGLPLGEGLVCRDSTADDGDRADPSCDGAGQLVIKVFWQEPRHGSDEDGGMRRFIYRLPWQ